MNVEVPEMKVSAVTDAAFKVLHRLSNGQVELLLLLCSR